MDIGCGKTSAYCSAGCQSGFGSCTGGSSSKKMSSSRTSSTRASSVVKSSAAQSSSVAKSSSAGVSSEARSSPARTSSAAKSSSVRLSSVAKSSSTRASSSVQSSSKRSSSVIASSKQSSSTSFEPASSVTNSLVSAQSSSKSTGVPNVSSPKLSPSASASQASLSSVSGSSSASIVASVGYASSASGVSSLESKLSSKASALAVSSSIPPVASISSSPLSSSALLSKVISASGSSSSSLAIQSSFTFSSAAASPSNGGSRSAFPNGDPLSDPSKITLTASSTLIRGDFVSVTDAHSGSTCLRISNTDPSGANIEAATAASLEPGTTYTVSVWIRAGPSGSGGCTASIVVGANTVIATSSSNVPSTWTQLIGTYTTGSESSAAIKLIFNCPAASPPGKLRRRQTDGGLDADDLDVTSGGTASGQSSSLPSTASQSSAAGSEISSFLSLASATLPVSAFSSSASVEAYATSGASSNSSVSSIFASAPSNDSSASVMSVSSYASPVSSTITSSASSVSATSGFTSSTTSASFIGCDPIMYGGYFGDAGTQSSTGNISTTDWAPFQEFDTTDVNGFASLPRGSTGYNYYTVSLSSTSFILHYQHSIAFCANVEYQFGLLLRSYKIGSSASAGCRMTILLDDQQLLADRPGSWDTALRYVGTKTSFPSATTASLALSFSCTARTKTDTSYRKSVGAIIDSIGVATAAGFQTPSSASVVGMATSDSATKTFPLTAPCTPTNFGQLSRSCSRVGDDWLSGGSFEDCDIDSYSYDRYSLLDEDNSGVVSEEARSGTKSFKAVFPQDGGSIGVRAKRLIWACQERDFKVSYSVKGSSNGACKLEHIWGNQLWRTTQVTTSWQDVSYTLISPYDTVLSLNPSDILGTYELRVTCTVGGLGNAVYLDDLSLGQLTYAPGNPPTQPEGPASVPAIVAPIVAVSSAGTSALATSSIMSSAVSPSPTLSPSPSVVSSADACRPTIGDGSFELAGLSGSTPDWLTYVASGGETVQMRPSNQYHHTGNYAYLITTNQNNSATFVQSMNFNYYPKGVSLCAGRSYVVSYWTTGYTFNNEAAMGCSASIQIGSKLVSGDQSGPADAGNWRQVSATFTADTTDPATGFHMNFGCPKSTLAGNNRGYM